jgi:hypothetical protein
MNFLNSRNRYFWRTSLVLLISVLGLCSSTGKGQDPNVNFEGLVDGVRVNIVEGTVFRAHDDARENLATGLVIGDGDRISTEQTSRSEILLQPGNYLRLSSDTHLRLLSSSYDKLRFELNSGTINFELVGDPWTHQASDSISLYDLIRVITPSGEVLVSQPSIIRINVSKDGSTEIIVRRGEAIFDGQYVKAKRAVVKKNNLLTITERDPKLEDDFDAWCRSRAELLVKANRALKKDPLWLKTHEEGKEPLIGRGSDSEDSSSTSPYVVSAKPGVIILVDAGVEILRTGSEWKDFGEDTQLKVTDRLRTGPYCRLELAIFPDIQLRLDGNSELLLEEFTNEGVTLKLARGAMIIDAAVFNQKNLPPIKIGGMSTVATIVSSGNYRVDVRAQTENITVRDGKVNFSGRSVGGCRTIANGVTSECDKKRNDNFDYWSQSRGEGQSFSGRVMATALVRSRKRELRDRGFWYRPVDSQQFTFVPYYTKTFESPYGGGYSVALAPSQLPRMMPTRRPGSRFPDRPIR